MRFLTDPIVRTSKELAALSSRLIDDGVSFLKSTWNAIPVFSGIRAHVAEVGCEEDVTHYFLIPFVPAEKGYALGTVRVLPEGVMPENNLPKRKRFHLPKAAGEEILRMLLREQIKGEKTAESDTESEMADWLEKVSEEIDKKSKLVTGGLLVIGGAVAVSNPLVGAAIAAKSLLPSVGGVFTRRGFGALVGKLRGRRKRQEEDAAAKAATSEVRSLRSEVTENAMLSILAQVVTNEGGNFDPDMAGLDLPTEVESMRIHALTAEAILGVYDEVLGSAKKQEEAGLDEVGVSWMRGLTQYFAGGDSPDPR